MLYSVRSRLTIWYLAVLAVVLGVFAIVVYQIFVHQLMQRVDATLHETAVSFSDAFYHELAEHQQMGVKSGADAIIQATREFRFRDRQLLILDPSHTLIATSLVQLSEPATLAQADIVQPYLQHLAPQFLAQTEQEKSVFDTFLLNSADKIRAHGVLTTVGGDQYIVIVVFNLKDYDAMLRRIQSSIWIAVLAALIISSFGGYFLALKSLSPVLVMSQQAEQIGATNLYERLDILNERDELGQLARVFNHMLARLQRAFDQQRRFMADASHELRTPVAIVRGEAEVALSQHERTETDYRESLGIIQNEGRRMTRIVEDLFTLARADAGQHPLIITDCYLDDLVEECVQAVRTLAMQRKISVVNLTRIEIPYQGDEGLLQRMILNLLNNAIKYTQIGGKVVISVHESEHHWMIDITDNGPGIPDDAQELIFERFYRVNKAASRADASSGAGLGLPIARWIAEAHQGALRLKSSTSSGSTFTVFLPKKTVLATPGARRQTGNLVWVTPHSNPGLSGDRVTK
ncbi:MAG TPA: ATP-binding protein [Acidobacteriota bacterium]|nr:ATP-binding protein [Acidobacteriota bacterium]